MENRLENRQNSSQNLRFLFLDGLRGVAAIAVILFHCYDLLSLHLAPPLPPYIDSLFFTGHFGVQIFFVLSGFVIAYSTRNAQFNLSFLKDFIIRRSIRLDPPYWVVIFSLIFLSMLGSLLFAKDSLYPLSFFEVAANFFYLQYLSHSPSILPVAWTLCIELQLYLVLMLLLVLCCQAIRKLRLSTSLFQSKIFSILFGALTLFCWLCHLNMITLFSAFSQDALFIFFWHQFLLGALVCWTLYKGLSEKIFYGFLLVMILFLAFDFNSEDVAAIAASLAIFIAAKRDRLSTLLTSSFIQWSGKISYSLYITHWVTGVKFIGVVKERILLEKINLPVAFALYVAAVLIIFGTANLFYKWIEEPSLRLSRNWRPAKKIPKDLEPIQEAIHTKM